MNWWNNISTLLSVGCTIFSIISAYKSKSYYQKNKQLNIFSNTSVAYTESQKIILELNEILKLSNNKITPRGINRERLISQKGDIIKVALRTIRERLSVKVCTEINTLLNAQTPKIETYIDSLITSEVFIEDNFVIDDNFRMCQHTFIIVQQLIKTELEKISES